jgi:hypothetical protein
MQRLVNEIEIATWYNGAFAMGRVSPMENGVSCAPQTVLLVS